MKRSSPFARKILLIGWDSADWKVINPLMDGGKMPNLDRMVNEGVMGNLATLYPDLSPMLWTSIATGKRPFKHGIYGFTEPDPHGRGIRPVTNLSRQTKAIWNILSQIGMKCVVVGWWPSHPAEPINGIMVSNLYTGNYAPIDKPWPMVPGTVHPERLIRNLAELRWHPQKLNAGHIMPFVPRAAEIDQDKDHRLETIAKIICDCSTIQAATLAIMIHEPWDFTAVYFDAIDHFSHAFMRYYPPREEWVPERDYKIYNRVVESGYIYHDMMLGRLLEQAGDDAMVLLVSDHGFQSDHLRPRRMPREPAGPAAQHRHYGIFAMKGPGIKKDESIFGATLLDICPTILTLLGLPVGKDMDGHPLVNAFESPPEIETIESWDSLPGKAGTHPPDRQIDPVEAQEAINQLVELGYIEKPDENREKAVSHTVRELHYNLARAYMDANLFVNAIPLLEELLKEWPDQYRFGVQLVTCYQAVKRVSDARRVVEDLFEQKKNNAARARERLKAFNEKHEAVKPEDLSEKELRELRDLRGEASFNPYSMEYLMGSVLFAEGDNAEALKHLKRAEKIDDRQPGLYLKLGDLYLKMKQWEHAERSFEKALDIDPDNAEAHLGLCRSYLPQKRNVEASEAAFDSVGLIYHNPMAHFFLGVALHRQGQIPQALLALKVAISQNPNYPEAHRRLAYIYKRRLGSSQKAEEHRRLAREAARRIRELKKSGGLVMDRESLGQKPDADPLPPEKEPVFETAPHSPALDNLTETVIVVSGLPRAGTSMIMQMLKAGGLPILTDGKRAADEDNPRGYFEYEPAKRFREDRSWLPKAKGKVFKLVVPLLRYLPPRFDYRVIFVERDLSEVMASQQKMLERQSRQGASLAQDRLGRVFRKQVQEAKKMLAARGIATLYIDYAQSVQQPAGAAAKIRGFLGDSLDEKTMGGVIDPDLYRQRFRKQ